VCAISKERLTRVKHDSGFFREVVDYCLEAAGIPLGRVDRVVRNCYVLPVPELERRLLALNDPYHLPPRDQERARSSPLFLSDAEKVVTVSHHLAHAYSAFAVSPFEEGAVMVVDGVGSYRADVTEDVPSADEAPPLARESESFYRFRGAEPECLRKVWLLPARGRLNDEFHQMDGLGALYSRVSSYAFGDWNKCGEVMGLAPYGRLDLDPMVELRDGELIFRPWGREMSSPFLGSGDDAWERSPHRSHWADCARRVQEDTERALLARAHWLHERTRTPNLTLAGGVALNCVANGRILRETPFERVFVQPAAGDDGVALGCALYGHLALDRRARTFVMKNASWGRTYDEPWIRAATSSFGVRVAAGRRRSPDVARETARLLARGKVVGWFQGGSEFGPRALGHRSILADPRDPRMKGRINARVKHRQAFRPYAPAVLAERVGDYFEGVEQSPFMLLAARVRPRMRDKIPAVVHVDGSARVQTVHADRAPRFHALLRAFEERTGIGVLLNTSFNVRGDPIVEDPFHAVETFLLTRLDVLVLHDWILRKRALHRVLEPWIRFAVRLRRNLGSEALLERAARRALDV
ncbi:MAG: carbamoyltransferase, partial [Planctomycetota bacterium]